MHQGRCWMLISLKNVRRRNQVTLSFHERLHETNELHSMLFFRELNIDGLGFYFCNQKILDML